MIVDSNILNYACSGNHPELITLVGQRGLAASILTWIEVFSARSLEPESEAALEQLFQGMDVVDVTPPVAELAARSRRRVRIKTPDAVIAATAIELGLALLTRNTKDFVHIDQLVVVNPFEEPEA
ncbi:MAG: type II toxin-antitoxin system VapC family toxin [Phycisphaerae bacterium]